MVRALYLAAGCRSLREVVELTEMSPAGVQDILRRLSAVGLVSIKVVGNRHEYSLNLNERESELLDSLCRSSAIPMIANRAKALSRKTAKAISWIDETLESINATRTERKNDRSS